MGDEGMGLVMLMSAVAPPGMIALLVSGLVIAGLVLITDLAGLRTSWARSRASSASGLPRWMRRVVMDDDDVEQYARDQGRGFVKFGWVFIGMAVLILLLYPT